MSVFTLSPFEISRVTYFGSVVRGHVAGISKTSDEEAAEEIGLPEHAVGTSRKWTTLVEEIVGTDDHAIEVFDKLEVKAVEKAVEEAESAGRA